jgi:formylglycine-generating enzyme required for sulfatase activity
MSADVPPEMRAIPPGSVSLSDRRMGRVWLVELKPYELATVPVTHAQYVNVTGLAPSASRGDRHPAESVSWLDAARLCNAL